MVEHLYGSFYTVELVNIREETYGAYGKAHYCNISKDYPGSSGPTTETHSVGKWCPLVDGATPNTADVSNNLITYGACPVPTVPPVCGAPGSGSAGFTGPSFGGSGGDIGKGNPIYLADGEKIERAFDWTSPVDSRFRFARTYRSKDRDWVNFATSGFGSGWSSMWMRQLQKNGSKRTLYLSEGATINFDYDSATSTWSADTLDHSYSLTADVAAEAGRHVIDLGNGQKQLYENVSTDTALLSELRWGDGYSISVFYDASNRIEAIEDNKGQRAEFTWDDTLNPNQTIASVTNIAIDTGYDGALFAPDLEISYGYETDLILSSELLTKIVTVSELATNTEIARWSYGYDQGASSSLRGKLTSIDDGRLDGSANAFNYAAFGYDDFGGNSSARAVSTSHFGGVDANLISTRTDTASGFDVTATNPLGKDTVYSYENVAGRNRIVGVEGISSVSVRLSRSDGGKEYLLDAHH